jgi:hypothetical protein
MFLNIRLSRLPFMLEYLHTNETLWYHDFTT